jgi:hypothetical protein
VAVRQAAAHPILAILACGLAGCGRGTPATATLNPAQFGISDAAVVKGSSRSGAAGAAITERQPDEIVAGFERTWSEDHNVQHFYRGAVRFDLGAITALKSKVIDKAILNFKIHQSYVRSPDGKPADFPNIVSCATEIYTATDEWPALVGSDVVTFKAPLPVNSLISTLASTAPDGFHIDVTGAAREWVVSPAQSVGVVLKGSDEKEAPARNDACATRYNGITLDVQYTVFER